jgi:hypothetical protein
MAFHFSELFHPEQSEGSSVFQAEILRPRFEPTPSRDGQPVGLRMAKFSLSKIQVPKC